MIEHVHYIDFGTRDSFTYVIFGIDINPLALEFDI